MNEEKREPVSGARTDNAAKTCRPSFFFWWKRQTRFALKQRRRMQSEGTAWDRKRGLSQLTRASSVSQYAYVTSRHGVCVRGLDLRVRSSLCSLFTDKKIYTGWFTLQNCHLLPQFSPYVKSSNSACLCLIQVRRTWLCICLAEGIAFQQMFKMYEPLRLELDKILLFYWIHKL